MPKTKIFGPIREHLDMLIEYINILELREDIDYQEEIRILISMINRIQKQLEIYLNCQFLKLGNK